MLTSLINVSQIPNASGTTGVQLMGNVTNKDGTQTQPIKVAVSGAGVAQLSSGGQSSGSLIAQQQVGNRQSNISFHVDTNLIFFSFFFLPLCFSFHRQLQMALQRQVQLQLQQKMAAKQKSKPPNS